MPKTKISEFSATPANNTDIDSINIAEGCAPSGINDAIRELMAQLKDFQTGAVGDSFNGPVGTTTAAAGAFTTLSSTGNTTLGDASGDSVTINGTATFANANPTLSAGTANGVAYLNGSKVVTSGSALTFDGTNLGLGGSPVSVGVAGMPAYAALSATSGRSGAFYWQDTGANNVAYSYFFGSVFQFGTSTNHPVAFIQSGSEQMRLTSTGLGIGTSSPDLSGASKALTVSGAVSSALEVAVGGSLKGGVIADSSAVYFSTRAAIPAVFEINGAEKMRLDTSGNLGLGVTPSAWGTGFQSIIETKNIGVLAAAGPYISVLANAYYNSSSQYIYKTTQPATHYAQAVGAHQWFTAPSGTAGNAITFTQAMTLTAAGDLALGTTSALGTASGRIVATVNGSSSALVSLGVGGTNTATYYADASLVAIGSKTSIPLSLQTGDTERARIDSSGNLLVGTTSVINSGKISISAALYTTSTGISIQNTQTTYGSSTSFAVFVNSGGGTAGNIYQSAGTTVNYNTSSDARLKEDIGVATDTSVIDNTIIHDFTWKADSRVDRGVFAQEAYEVKPSAVGIGRDDLTESGELVQPWSVDYSKYVPDLIVHAQQLKKQVQEQQAIIESLKARLDAANL